MLMQINETAPVMQDDKDPDGHWEVTMSEDGKVVIVLVRPKDDSKDPAEEAVSEDSVNEDAETPAEKDENGETPVVEEGKPVDEDQLTDPVEEQKETDEAELPDSVDEHPSDITDLFPFDEAEMPDLEIINPVQPEIIEPAAPIVQEPVYTPVYSPVVSEPLIIAEVNPDTIIETHTINESVAADAAAEKAGPVLKAVSENIMVDLPEASISWSQETGLKILESAQLTMPDLAIDVQPEKVTLSSDDEIAILRVDGEPVEMKQNSSGTIAQLEPSNRVRQLQAVTADGQIIEKTVPASTRFDFSLLWPMLMTPVLWLFGRRRV